jgi:hypothetical protein
LRRVIGGSYDQADRRLLAPNFALLAGLYDGRPRRPAANVVAELSEANWLVPDLVDYVWHSVTWISTGRRLEF